MFIPLKMVLIGIDPYLLKSLEYKDILTMHLPGSRAPPKHKETWLCLTCLKKSSTKSIGWSFSPLVTKYGHKLMVLSTPFIWLVVYLPLWKIWVRQLGWWHSQLNGNIENVPNYQPVMDYPPVIQHSLNGYGSIPCCSKRCGFTIANSELVRGFPLGGAQSLSKVGLYIRK